MARKKYRPGSLAKSILDQTGDIDVSTAPAEDREAIMTNMQGAARLGVARSGLEATLPLRNRIAGIQKRLSDREEIRKQKDRNREDRLDQGRLWRRAGIYEKTAHIDLPDPFRYALYCFLAGLDFYVFADAWAVGTDSRTFDALWWIGGFIGLAVFVAGFFAAVQVKRRAVAKKQTKLLDDLRRRDAPKKNVPVDDLVVLEWNFGMLFGSLALFTLLLVLGVLVRAGNESSDGNDYMVLMAGLVPAMALLAELVLHDPMAREEAKPTWIDRRLSKHLAKLERRLGDVEELTDMALQEVDARYAVEHSIIAVEIDDRGIKRRGA